MVTYHATCGSSVQSVGRPDETKVPDARPDDAAIHAQIGHEADAGDIVRDGIQKPFK